MNEHSAGLTTAFLMLPALLMLVPMCAAIVAPRVGARDAARGAQD